MSSSFSYPLFNKMPIVGIMRNVNPEHTETIAEIYWESGLTCLEITMNSPGAEKSIARLVDLYQGKLNIGAGTVCSMDDLEKAIAAKAQFIVTPVINEEVIKACVVLNVPVFPGAYTPSEIYKAWSLGAAMIKLFPAGDLKPSYVKEILAPLNQVNLMPTGGITLDNFAAYLAHGAKGVGIGSQLFPKAVIENKDWDSLRLIFLQLAERYQNFIVAK